MCSAREEAGLGRLVASCPSQRTARWLWGCRLAQGLPLCSVSQPSPAPQELSEQPAGPTSPLGGLPGGHAQEAPTASPPSLSPSLPLLPDFVSFFVSLSFFPPWLY